MPENFEQKSELHLFREKIARLKEEEEQARATGQSTTRHLRDLDPMLLTEEDMAIYRRWQEGTLPLEEFSAHKNKVVNHDRNANSGEFLAYISNKWMREERERFSKQQEEKNKE